ncbi:hypothetical protein NN561_007488 [Cricetulus griseus]
MYKSVFSIEIGRHNLTPPPWPPWNPAPPRWFSYAHRSTTSHLSKGGKGDSTSPSRVLPSLLRIRIPAGPECSERLLEARRQEAGTESARTQTAPAPRTPDDPPVPALIPSRSTQIRAPWCPRPPPPVVRTAHRARTAGPFRPSGAKPLSGKPQYSTPR